MKEEPYNSIPDLQWIYLEDSWVLAIEVTPGTVEFHLEAVLLEQHPLYEPPRGGEAYCYRRAVLSFGDVSKVEWSMHNARTVDASGEVDYGNIDVMTRSDVQYHLEGDWGDMRLSARTFGFTLIPTE